jgi:hypothetical protein
LFELDDFDLPIGERKDVQFALFACGHYDEDRTKIRCPKCGIFNYKKNAELQRLRDHIDSDFSETLVGGSWAKMDAVENTSLAFRMDVFERNFLILQPETLKFILQKFPFQKVDVTDAGLIKFPHGVEEEFITLHEVFPMKFSWDDPEAVQFYAEEYFEEVPVEADFESQELYLEAKAAIERECHELYEENIAERQNTLGELFWASRSWENTLWGLQGEGDWEDVCFVDSTSSENHEWTMVGWILPDGCFIGYYSRLIKTETL